MARLVSLTNPVLFVVLIFSAAWFVEPLQAQGKSNKQEKLLRKRLERAKADYQKALQVLNKKKEACRNEYGTMKTAPAKEKLAGLLDTVRGKYLVQLTAGGLKKVKRELTKDVQSALRLSIGKYLSSMLATPLRDELLARMTADDYSAINVVKTFLDEAFTGDFDDDWSSDISKNLSRNTDAKRALVEKYERELSELERTAAARQSGLPFGMVRVEGGEYPCGVNKKDLQTFSKLVKTPLHKIHLTFRSTPIQMKKLEPFLIDMNEVTCEAWLEFLKDTGRKRYPKHWIDNAIPKDFAKRPVTFISYEDVRAFCKWVGRRLPTEFEWEVAARYGRGRKILNYWTWGDTAPHPVQARDRANFDGLFDDKRRPQLIKGVHHLPPVMRVGSFPNGVNKTLKVYDMCGNAAEFTSSPFTPYKGFEAQKIGPRSVNATDFDRYKIVVRGGHGLNKRELVTTFWRLGMSPESIASCVGFRTAATPIKGKDHLDALLGEGDYERYLVDFGLLDSDRYAKRKAPGLDLEDPARFTALQAGGWNMETGLPTRARFISIVNRKANDFRNVDGLNHSMEKASDPILMGFLHTDVAVEEPKLDPADYLVLWQPRHEEVIEPEEPEEGKETEKEKKGKEKKVETRKVPDQILFYNVKKSKAEMVAVNMQFRQPVVATAQPSAIRQTGKDGSEVELVFAYPLKNNKAKAFVLTIPLKTKPGVTSEYK